MRKFRSDTLLVASHNIGKLEEISALLLPYGVSTLSAASLGLSEPDETEDSFVGNARLKARAACAAAEMPALADDSGICVDALGGAPGVYTADWAEAAGGRDFELAMRKTWSLLERANAPYPRSAQFRCTLVLAWPDGHDEVFEGQMAGQVVWPGRGEQGHGYDPIFQPDGYAETFGEMDRWQKNQISHRADAFRKLIKQCFT